MMQAGMCVTAQQFSASDGVRTYRLTPGDPKGTSYGEDCFRKIFGTDTQAGGPRARPSRQVAQ